MSVYDFSARRIDGTEQSLADFRGRVLLVVNVASRCGFTPQYKGLQQLHEQFSARGFTVLGFPCDQFGHQEPGTEAEIAQFCDTHYHVTFPLYAKIEVNGPNAHPIYKALKQAATGVLGTEAIKWNFTKFLIDRDGNVVRRYAPTDKPERIEKDAAALL